MKTRNMKLASFTSLQTFIHNLIKGRDPACKGQAFEQGGKTSLETFKEDLTHTRICD